MCVDREGLAFVQAAWHTPKVEKKNFCKSTQKALQKVGQDFTQHKESTPKVGQDFTPAGGGVLLDCEKYSLFWGGSTFEI